MLPQSLAAASLCIQSFIIHSILAVVDWALVNELQKTNMNDVCVCFSLGESLNEKHC